MDTLKKIFSIFRPIKKSTFIVSFLLLTPISVLAHAVTLKFNIEMEYNLYSIVILLFLVIRRLIAVDKTAAILTLATATGGAIATSFNANIFELTNSTFISFFFFAFIMLTCLIQKKKTDIELEENEGLKLTFKEFLKYVFLTKEGRLNRKIYLFASFILITLSTVLSISIDMVSNYDLSKFITPVLLFLIVVYFHYCLVNKRVNDFSGKRILVILSVFILPILINAILMFIDFDNVESAVFIELMSTLILLFVVYLIVDLIILLKKSKLEDNTFGENPLNNQSLRYYSTNLVNISMIILLIIAIASFTFFTNLEKNMDEKSSAVTKCSNMVLNQTNIDKYENLSITEREDFLTNYADHFCSISSSHKLTYDLTMDIYKEHANSQIMQRVKLKQCVVTAIDEMGEEAYSKLSKQEAKKYIDSYSKKHCTNIKFTVEEIKDIKK